MGSAWREVGEKKAFKRVLSTIKEVKEMGMEVCCTLGMLNEEQAVQVRNLGEGGAKLWAFEMRVFIAPIKVC